MPFFVVRNTWNGSPGAEPPRSTELVAGCSSSAHATGLAEAEAHAYRYAGRDPDTGAWWASDAGQLHSIVVTTRWPV